MMTKEERKKYMKKYNQRPENKVKRKEYEQKPENKIKKERYHKKWKENNPTWTKEYYKKNKNKISKQGKKYRENPEVKEKRRKYDEKNKSRFKNTKYKNHLKRKYGITLKEYNKLLLKQGGVCAICRNKGNGKALSVDHNHQTGKIRGLICSSCNLTLGYAKENVDRLENCIKYLNFYREVKK